MKKESKETNKENIANLEIYLYNESYLSEKSDDETKAELKQGKLIKCPCGYVRHRVYLKCPRCGKGKGDED